MKLSLEWLILALYKIDHMYRSVEQMNTLTEPRHRWTMTSKYGWLTQWNYKLNGSSALLCVLISYKNPLSTWTAWWRYRPRRRYNANNSAWVVAYHIDSFGSWWSDILMDKQLDDFCSVTRPTETEGTVIIIPFEWLGSLDHERRSFQWMNSTFCADIRQSTLNMKLQASW